MVQFSLQVVPLGDAQPYPIIAAAIQAIQATGVRYEVNAFTTIMEGEYSELEGVVRAAKEAAFAAGAVEVLLNLQIHAKRDADVLWDEKTAQYR